MQKIMSMHGYSILSDKTESGASCPTCKGMKRISVLYFLGQMDDGRDSDRFGSDEKRTRR
jgi:hypothetical protein